MSTNVATDERFGPAFTEFDLNVPHGFKHGSCIDAFSRKVKARNTGYHTYYWNDNISDKHFALATNELDPGKTYRARIFPILARVESADCLAFLRGQQAVLSGAQGLILAYDLMQDKFPMGKSVVSFDEEQALWEDFGGNRGMPLVRCHPESEARIFLLGFFGNFWGTDDCLLCLNYSPKRKGQTRKGA